jgi:ribose transport system permease protein
MENNMKNDRIAAIWRKTGFLQQIAFPVGLLIVLFACAGAINPQFLSWDSIRIQLTLATFIGIAGIGQTLAILIGQIDLSIPANITLAAILSANMYGQTSSSLLAFATALGVGVCTGLLNFAGVAWLRVPSLIWTLSVNLVLQGVTLVYTNATAPSSTISPLVRWVVTGSIIGIPALLIFWTLCGTACLLVLHATAFGRRLYALGNNELASAMSGVNVFQIYLPVYLTSGIAGSIAGVLLSGYSGQTYLGMGDSYLLIPIAAVVIGGTSLAGGSGGYFGTLIGSIAVVQLDSLLTSLQVSPGLRKIFFGIIVLGMMLVFRRKRATV